MIVQPYRFLILRCGRGRSLSCRLLCRRCRRLLRKFLIYNGGTGISAGDYSAVIFNGHDGGSHGFFGVEEALMLPLLVGHFSVHSNLKII